MIVVNPAEIAVSNPELFIVATAGLLLDQFPPPTDAENDAVSSSQMVLGPVIFTFPLPSTVKEAVAAETQPVAVFVKTKVVLPAETPVTTPALVTV